MSVVEREEVVQVTDAERRARVLEAAALEIEVRGWHQGGYHGNEGEVCILAAIRLGGDAKPFAPCDKAYGIPSNVAAWNDDPARTADEVTFLLRWRAAEIRDGWDARAPEGR